MDGKGSRGKNSGGTESVPEPRLAPKTGARTWGTRHQAGDYLMRGVVNEEGA